MEEQAVLIFKNEDIIDKFVFEISSFWCVWVDPELACYSNITASKA